MYAEYRATMKSLIRSPTILLAILGGILLIFANGTGNGTSTSEYDWALMGAAISNHVNTPITSFLPAFIGVIIGFDLLKDKENRFHEILETSQLSFTKYYISKLLAYITIGFVGYLVTVIIDHVDLLATVNLHFEYNILSVLKMFFVRILFVFPAGIFTFMSITVFSAAIFNRGSVGIVFSVLYAQIRSLFLAFFAQSNFFTLYIYPVPMKMLCYWFYWGTEKNESYQDIFNSMYGEVSFRTMFLSFSIEIGISLALLIAGGLIIKKRCSK